MRLATTNLRTTMSTKSIFQLAGLLLILFIAGCNPQVLKYKIDPEFGALDVFAGNSKIVAIKINDHLKPTSSASDITISRPENIAGTLKKGLINQLKDLDYKIINNPLLADLAITMDLRTLDVKIDTQTFKSELSANSEFQLTIRRKGEEWTKVFRSGRTQEIANPAKDRDVSGVINQLLSRQLAAAFADPKLMEFLAKLPRD